MRSIVHSYLFETSGTHHHPDSATSVSPSPPASHSIGVTVKGMRWCLHHLVGIITLAILALALLTDTSALQVPMKGSHKKQNYTPQTKYSDIIPVFHNVEDKHIDDIRTAMEDCNNIGKFTVSLRHATALESLKSILYKNKRNRSPMRIGASTVSSIEQLLTCFEYDVDFISTMHFNREITQMCTDRGVPILCGVRSLKEAQEALAVGATSIKFYPVKEILPQSLLSIIMQLNTNRRYENAKYYVAGGITESDIEVYKNIGADGFAIGIDCTKDSMDNIIRKLKSFNELSKNSI